MYNHVSHVRYVRGGGLVHPREVGKRPAAAVLPLVQLVASTVVAAKKSCVTDFFWQCQFKKKCRRWATS